MSKISSLIKQLNRDFPRFTFKPSDAFWWSPSSQTIHYNQASKHSGELVLHELSHAILGHNTYRKDIELLVIEREAWDYAATQLADKYNVTINDEFVQSNLDSYRDWLQNRSACPVCGSNGLQTSRDTYECPACKQIWKVNEAKNCALRRYKLSK